MNERATVPPRTAGRGFWIVAGALGVGCVLLVVQILANRGIAETIAHAQGSLRTAQAAAEEVLAGSGSFAGADARALASLSTGLRFRPGGSASSGLDDVSVATSATVWAAAVRAGSDACFYLRLEIAAAPRYGVGGACTGRAALGASDDRW